MFPVDAPGPKAKVVKALKLFAADNQKARLLGRDGRYRRKSPGRRESPVRCQGEFHRQAVLDATRARAAAPTEFVPQTKGQP